MSFLPDPPPPEGFESGRSPVGEIPDAEIASFLEPGVLRLVSAESEQPTLEVDELRRESPHPLAGEREPMAAPAGGLYPFWFRQYRYSRGRITIERDGVTVKVSLHRTTAGSGGAAEEVATFSLRDRAVDGTEEALRYPLPRWYFSDYLADGPERNAVDIQVRFRSVLTPISPDPFFRRFLRNPYAELTPDGFFTGPHPRQSEITFLRYWFQVFDEGANYPGQDSPPIPGAFAHFVRQCGRILPRLGYHSVWAVPCYFQLAFLLYEQPLQFRFALQAHKEAFLRLRKKVAGLELDWEQRGRRLSSVRKSWIVLLQSLGDKRLIPFREWDFDWDPLADLRSAWMVKRS